MKKVVLSICAVGLSLLSSVSFANTDNICKSTSKLLVTALEYRESGGSERELSTYMVTQFSKDKKELSVQRLNYMNTVMMIIDLAYAAPEEVVFNTQEKEKFLNTFELLCNHKKIFKQMP